MEDSPSATRRRSSSRRNRTAPSTRSNQIQGVSGFSSFSIDSQRL